MMRSDNGKIYKRHIDSIHKKVWRDKGHGEEFLKSIIRDNMRLISMY